MIGKLSFTDEQLTENARTFFSAIVRAKPTSAKGVYLKGATICSTMSPGIKLDTAEVTSFAK